MKLLSNSLRTVSAALSVLFLSTLSRGSWQRSYDHSGSKGVLHHWQVTGLAGHQTATPVDFETTPPVSTTLNSFGISHGRESYYPTTDLKMVSLPISADVTFKTKTTFTWVGPDPVPAKLYVLLHGLSISEYDAESGSTQADNGLHDPEIVFDSYGPIHFGASPNYHAYDINFKQVNCEGRHYRQFTPVNGKVEFITVQHVSTSSLGVGDENEDDLTASCQFDATTDQRGLAISSDRDITYRRVVKSDGSIVRMSNAFEDDGTTIRGGDGQTHGDSVASEAGLLNGQRDFASTFVLNRTGSWSNNSDFGMSSGANLGAGSGSGYFQLVCGYENIPDSSSKPIKQFQVFGYIVDSAAALSDTCSYDMKVHLLAEKEDLLATFASDYLYWAKDDANFADYNADPHIPQIKMAEENATPNPAQVSYTVSDTISATLGFEYTSTQGAELTIEIAKILYNDVFKISGSITVTKSTTSQSSFTISGNHRLEVWECDSGTLNKNRSSRWNDSGYEKDAIDYEITNFTANLKYWQRPLATARRTPHMGDGDATP